MACVSLSVQLVGTTSCYVLALIIRTPLHRVRCQYSVEFGQLYIRTRHFARGLLIQLLFRHVPGNDDVIVTVDVYIAISRIDIRVV